MCLFAVNLINKNIYGVEHLNALVQIINSWKPTDSLLHDTSIPSSAPLDSNPHNKPPLPSRRISQYLVHRAVSATNDVLLLVAVQAATSTTWQRVSLPTTFIIYLSHTIDFKSLIFLKSATIVIFIAFHLAFCEYYDFLQHP